MATKTKSAVVEGFDPAVPLAKIHQHPKNPRRNATASDELVESVKAQGLMQALVLAPHTEIAGEYVLIAGHRRTDALTRAGAKTAKAEIRTDLVTDVQQIEAMLTENGGRVDLTPIEEAEAYEQLQLFNLKPADIARATGRSRQTVASRLKLLALGEESRTKIHDGQVTIDDALALTELPKAAREELEPLLGSSDFRWKLGQHRDRQRQAEKRKAEIKVLAELGIQRYSDEPVDIWELSRDGLVQRVSASVNDATIVQVIDRHTECLRWCESGSYNGIPNIHLVCADPDSHVDENADPSTSVDAERAAREARWEAQR
ncbi:MAG TPA: ParB/RepB/Spo0J family partition protein, partial [Nocardioides sp.]|nr:ParB/RepB/Spo0J family partition protein [Nocardioides sp.]